MPRPTSTEKRQKRGTQLGERSDDDFGCLLLIIAILWFSGVLSFNWGERSAERRLSRIRQELAVAEATLAKAIVAAERTVAEAESLSVQRDALREQVANLSRVRDDISEALGSASRAIESSARPRWLRITSELFTGVIGNLISAVIVAGVSWLHGRKVGRKQGNSRGRDSA